MLIAETERLRLSTWRLPEDLDEAHALWSDPRVMEHVGAPHDHARTQRALEAAIAAQQAEGYCLWRVVHRTGPPVGCAGFLAYDGPGSRRPGARWLELGYHLRPEAWGQGLATEAARACLALAPALGTTHVVALAAEHNAASCRVLAKLGFVLDGTDDALLRFVLPIVRA